MALAKDGYSQVGTPRIYVDYVQYAKAIGMVKKHLKPTKENKGGIISKESFIHQSNIKSIGERLAWNKKELVIFF